MVDSRRFRLAPVAAASLLLVFAMLPMASGSIPLAKAGQDRELSEEARAKILEGLEKGIWALRELGLEEEVGRLQQVARSLSPARESDADRKRDPEREQAIQEIELLGAALGALREARREDAADLLARAIKARKMALSGRRDEEARMVREHSPDIGQQAELLMLAAELYADWGHERRAETIGKLGRHYAEIARRRRAAGGSERQARSEAGARGDRVERLTGQLEELIRHSERLTMRVERLEQMLERLLKDRRDR